MNLIELDRALRQLRLGGMAAVLETRLRQAQAEAMAPIDLIACLVSDELTLRTDRLLQRRRKQAAFRDADRTLDNFDFTFNPKMNRSLVFDLATAAFINKREDALFLGPGGTGKSHLAQAIGQCAIQQGYKVLYRETHILLDELADAVADGTRKEYMESVATVPLLIIDDFGMRKLPHTAAEDLLEIIMRRYERFSTLLTSNRPVEDWGKLLGDVAAVSAMLDRLLHHGHVLKCGPRSWRTKTAAGIVRKKASSDARALPSRSRDLSLSRQNGSLMQLSPETTCLELTALGGVQYYKCTSHVLDGYCRCAISRLICFCSQDWSMSSTWNEGTSNVLHRSGTKSKGALIRGFCQKAIFLGHSLPSLVEPCQQRWLPVCSCLTVGRPVRLLIFVGPPSTWLWPLRSGTRSAGTANRDTRS